MMTSSWITTREPISAKSPSMGRVHLSFSVGMWEVCPRVANAQIETDQYLFSVNEELRCSSIDYYKIWKPITHKDLNLWAPVMSTTNVVTRMRCFTFFAILGLAAVAISALFTIIGHFINGHNMLVASIFYAFGGLMVGSSLIILISVVSDEFNHKLMSDSDVEDLVSYSYSYSFLLGLISFLGSELSAVLCFSAYMDQFQCEQDFVKLLPGMARRIAEVELNSASVKSLVAASDHSADLADHLKGSFGHHTSTDSSVDTLPELNGHIIHNSDSSGTIDITHGNGNAIVPFENSDFVGGLPVDLINHTTVEDTYIDNSRLLSHSATLSRLGRSNSQSGGPRPYGYSQSPERVAQGQNVRNIYGSTSLSTATMPHPKKKVTIMETFDTSFSSAV